MKEKETKNEFVFVSNKGLHFFEFSLNKREKANPERDNIAINRLALNFPHLDSNNPIP